MLDRSFVAQPEPAQAPQRDSDGGWIARRRLQVADTEEVLLSPDPPAEPGSGAVTFSGPPGSRVDWQDRPGFTYSAEDIGRIGS